MTDEAAPPKPAFIAEIMLTKPVGKNGQVECVRIRAFKPSEMFGLLYSLLCMGDVDQMRQLIPRVTSPSLIGSEIDALVSCDLCEIIEAICDYIQPTEVVEGTLELTQAIGDVSKLSLREPDAGELRGLQVRVLKSGSVDQMLTLIPRIASPRIASEDLGESHMADFANLTGAVLGFLLPPTQRVLFATASKT